jgi:uncharacterized protein (TIGR02466 family)
MEKSMNLELDAIFSIPIAQVDVAGKNKISNILNNLDLNKFVLPVSENYMKGWNCNVKTGIGLERTEESYKWIDVFLQEIKPYLMEYLYQLSSGGKELKINALESWINIYDYGDSQEMHNHTAGNVVFSYCYFHKIPKNSGELVFFDDNTPKIHLGQQNGITFRTVGGNYVPEMKEGKLIIFPSWVNHYVTTHKAQEQRITISGNIRYEL